MLYLDDNVNDMNTGFLRVASAAPRVAVADVKSNTANILRLMGECAGKGAQLVVFPELCVTGYTCADIFHQRTLLEGAQDAVIELASESLAFKSTAFVIGAPLEYNGSLYNCAVFIACGKIVGIVPKTYLPNYNEFYEARWFESGYNMFGNLLGAPFGTNLLFNVSGVKVGAEICEDLWVPQPPSTELALAGAELIVNLSASNDLIGKYNYLRHLIEQQSARTITGYVYSSAGYGESTTDAVFDAKLIIAENGKILANNSRWSIEEQFVITDIDIEAITRDRMHLKSFAACARNNRFECDTVECELLDRVCDNTLLRDINPHPFVPASGEGLDERCQEIVNIQAFALAKRLEATNTKTLVIGVSGGLDSTLALLVAVRAFDILKIGRKGIVGVTMPGFGTSGRTYTNAVDLMGALGITSEEISIVKAVTQHFTDIGQEPNITDVTYENSQARERTQILMDLANKLGGMVLGTGDLSELALGWATYNGDHMSMYAVNAGVPKTLVRHLVRYFANTVTDNGAREILLDIVDTPISPELTPTATDGTIAQKTEDLVGPYDLHDFFLYYTLRYGFTPTRILFMAERAFKNAYDRATILKWMRIFYRRFFNQQFKRSCMPDGPKIGSVCLSPRSDWKMPSDALSAQWLSEIPNE